MFRARIDFYNTVEIRYFETMGIRLIEGRYFDERDADKAPLSVIVNQTVARTYWPNQSALGHRMKIDGNNDWSTVVGVVADVKNAGLDKPTGSELYVPLLQKTTNGAGTGYLVVRTAGDPWSMASPVRNAIHAIDPSLPVASVRTMDDIMLAAQSRPRFLAVLLTIFSGVALTLAALGIYGVISYSVAQRTNEFGIRIAMGASSGKVLGLVLGQGAKIAVIGFAIGTAGAFWFTRFMSAVLFQVSAMDPLTFVAMLAILALVTLLACYVPARRATKVDPMIALRYE